MLRRWSYTAIASAASGLLSLVAAPDAGADYILRIQSPARPFDSRPADGAPTPAPRSSNSGTILLPRVPYDNRIDRSRRYVPERQLRRTPDSQRVVPAPPPAGGNPSRFVDPPAESALSCESLRRLATRTDAFTGSPDTRTASAQISGSVQR